MKRTHHHFAIHYLLLPILLVGSDILIGMYGHYSGSAGLENIFSLEHFIDYITTEWAELLLIVGIALVIVVIVEWYVQSVVAHTTGKSKVKFGFK